MRWPLVLSALPALAPGMALPASAASPTVHYEGSGDHGFTVKLDRRGRSLSYVVTYQAPCDMAGVQDNLEYGTGSPSAETLLRVDRHGRFREHRRGLDTPQRTFDVDFSGRLGRHGASGSFTTTIHTKMGDGLTCRTGLVHWTARRG